MINSKGSATTDVFSKGRFPDFKGFKKKFMLFLLFFVISPTRRFLFFHLYFISPSEQQLFKTFPINLKIKNSGITEPCYEKLH